VKICHSHQLYTSEYKVKTSPQTWWRGKVGCRRVCGGGTAGNSGQGGAVTSNITERRETEREKQTAGGETGGATTQ